MHIYVLSLSLSLSLSHTHTHTHTQGLTWGMLPLHASGLAACTYHFFYNSSDLSFLVALQAGLTLLGNTTVAIAALRIALANGFKFQLPGQGDGTEKDGRVLKPLSKLMQVESEPVLLAKLTAATFASAYVVKYGQLATGLGFEPSAPAALAMVLLPPVVLANYFVGRGNSAPVATDPN